MTIRSRRRRRRHPSSSCPPALQPPQQKGGGDGAAGQLERTGYDTDTATNVVAMEKGLLGRRVRRQGPSGGGVGQDGARRRRLVGCGASGRRRSAVTQQSTRGGVRLYYWQCAYPVRRLGQDKEEKDTVILLLLILCYFNHHNSDGRCQDVAKVCSEEEAADGTAGADGSFNVLATADGEGSSSSSSSIYIKITQQTFITAIQ